MKMKNEKKLNKKKELKKGNVDNKKIDKIKGNSELKNSVKIVFFVALIFGFFYLLTYVLVGDLSIFDKEDDKIETTIQYDEILAGSSFAMKPEKYLVVYYDFTDEELLTIKPFCFLTLKPIIYLANVSEDHYNDDNEYYNICMNIDFQKILESSRHFGSIIQI